MPNLNTLWPSKTHPCVAILPLTLSQTFDSMACLLKLICVCLQPVQCFIQAYLKIKKIRVEYLKLLQKGGMRTIFYTI